VAHSTPHATPPHHITPKEKKSAMQGPGEKSNSVLVRYLLSVVARDPPVQPLARVASEIAELFDQVYHAHHLGKDEHLDGRQRDSRSGKVRVGQGKTGQGR
jgi:hypothetical protein